MGEVQASGQDRIHGSEASLPGDIGVCGEQERKPEEGARHMGRAQIIFVFGSNLAGRHGLGAAKYAMEHHGAEYGVGKGPTGRAYALPTKRSDLSKCKLPEIQMHVEEFLRYARQHPELTFQVTPIGCGLAGYKPSEIAPFFRDAPNNCDLPDVFREVLDGSSA